MRDRICIILFNQNEKSETIDCLASLSKMTHSPLSTIVIDNASTDGSIDSIRTAFPKTPIFENAEPLGYARAVNMGIEWALSKPFKWILLLSNKANVAPNFLTELISEAAKNPEVKVIGPTISYQDREICGGIWNKSLGTLEWTSEEKIDYLSRDALFFHRSVAETIGVLDPRYFSQWADADFCFRARRKGFSIHSVSPKVWVKSCSKTVESPYHYWQSRLLWMKRNLTPAERKEAFRTVIRQDLRKMIGFSSEKFAGLMGVIHFYLGIYGKEPYLGKGNRFRSSATKVLGKIVLASVPKSSKSR